MKEEEFEIAIKVVIVGNGAVGKSSMIQRYCKGIFTKDYKKTIGVDFLERELEFHGEEIRLMLWDTAGQEEFDAITKAYYRGAQACVLVFSTTDRDSMEAISDWKRKVDQEVGGIPMVLVQNKIDLQDQALMHEDEPVNLANRHNLKLFRTSVKDNFNIDSGLSSQGFTQQAVKHIGSNDKRSRRNETELRDFSGNGTRVNNNTDSKAKPRSGNSRKRDKCVIS